MLSILIDALPIHSEQYPIHRLANSIFNENLFDALFKYLYSIKLAYRWTNRMFGTLSGETANTERFDQERHPYSTYSDGSDRHRSPSLMQNNVLMIELKLSVSFEDLIEYIKAMHISGHER